MGYALAGRVIATVGLTGALALAMVGTASAAEGESVQTVAPTSVVQTLPADPPDCNEEFVNAGAAMGAGALAGAPGGPAGSLGGAAGGGIVGGTSLAQCLEQK